MAKEICPRCLGQRIPKPLSRGRKDGWYCKVCVPQMSRLWKENNREKKRAHGKRWLDENREKKRQMCREWKLKNPEKIKKQSAKQAIQRRENPDKFRCQYRQSSRLGRQQLVNGYVRKLLVQSVPLLTGVPAKLLEAKRQHVLLLRSIKETKNVIKKANK